MALLGRLPYFLSLLPFRVIFSTDLPILYSGTLLFIVLIRVYFPAHVTSPSEAARDGTIADSPVLASTVLSGFCTDLAVAGPCASFNTWLPVCISISILTCRFYRSRG
jgi:hypothetical protein